MKKIVWLVTSNDLEIVKLTTTYIIYLLLQMIGKLWDVVIKHIYINVTGKDKIRT